MSLKTIAGKLLTLGGKLAKACECCWKYCCVNVGEPDECGNYAKECQRCPGGPKPNCDEPCPERPPCILQCVEIDETPCGDPVYDCPVYDTEIIGIPVESCEECPEPPPCDEYYCCYQFEPSQNPESPLPPRNCQIGPCSAPELYSSGPHPTLVQCAAVCENWYCCYTEQPSQNPEVPLPPSACQLGPCASIELQRSGPHYTLQACQESCQDYYCCYDEQPSENPEIPLPSSTCQVGPCASPELYNSGPHMSLAACQANCECTCDAFYSETLTYTYNENTGDLGPYCSFTYVRGQQLFTIPAHIPLPARVVLTGTVNDDLVLNGKVVQKGLFPFGGNPCNGAHEVNYCFTATSRTFTLATKDNYGSGMSADITIQFCCDDGCCGQCDAETPCAESCTCCEGECVNQCSLPSCNVSADDSDYQKHSYTVSGGGDLWTGPPQWNAGYPNQCQTVWVRDAVTQGANTVHMVGGCAIIKTWIRYRLFRVNCADQTVEDISATALQQPLVGELCTFGGPSCCCNCSPNTGTNPGFLECTPEF